MMKKTLLALFLGLIGLPLFAQSTSVSLFLTSSQNGGGDAFASQPDVTTEFENGSGFGLALSRDFRSMLSAEVAVFRVSSEGSLRAGTLSLSLGDVDLMPVTAMLRLHLRRDQPFDVYVGAGAAYVLADDLDSADLRGADLAPIEIGDETTYVVGAGANWNFAGRWGVTLDARYLPLELSGSVGGSRENASIDPLLVSAGLRVRF